MNTELKILLYGYGYFGKIYYEYLKDEEMVKIVAITDKNETGVKILTDNEKKLFKKREEAFKNKYDYILITSAKFFDEIKTELVNEFQIAEKQVISVEQLNELILKKSNNGENLECNLCGKKVYTWYFNGLDYEIFKKKKIIGAGRRKGTCPACFSVDRERYVYYIMKNYTNILNEDVSILHFAPESHLQNLLRIRHKNYVTADIVEGRADVVCDITQMQFQNESFDWIICNHVMEHIVDERKAFLEIFRCLNKRGKLLMSVPICWEIDTYENKNIVTEEERILHFGQSDHVRLYGKDIIKRIEEYGFEVKLYKSSKICSEHMIKKNGFIDGDSVLIVKKQKKLGDSK